MSLLNNLMNSRTFIIAEAGVNHNGCIEIAKKLVDAAHEAGADAVKFQTFKSEKLVTKSAAMAQYQKKNTGKKETQLQMLKKLELPYESHMELYNYCEEKGIMFMSTPFDIDSVDLLEKLNIKLYKIGSGDITNMPLLKYIAKKNKPIILSTGMANLGEVEEAINWIQEEGNDKIILLHCTTDYPTSYEDVNLKAMETMRQAFKLPVGYSDHTLGIEIPIAAVAMGACVIEKHFTLDKTMEGPDHKASLDVAELKEMVRSIRNLEKAFGNGIKKRTKAELSNEKVVRKSIIAIQNIKTGTVITKEMIDVKRPGTGIQPKFINDIIGMKVSKDIQKDNVINWCDLKE